VIHVVNDSPFNVTIHWYAKHEPRYIPQHKRTKNVCHFSQKKMFATN
jgi:hypothetical protein